MVAKFLGCLGTCESKSQSDQSENLSGVMQHGIGPSVSMQTSHMVDLKLYTHGTIEFRCETMTRYLVLERDLAVLPVHHLVDRLLVAVVRSCSKSDRELGARGVGSLNPRAT